VRPVPIQPKHGPTGRFFHVENDALRRICRGSIPTAQPPKRCTASLSASHPYAIAHAARAARRTGGERTMRPPPKADLSAQNLPSRTEPTSLPY